jgi:hypothetical protein
MVVGVASAPGTLLGDGTLALGVPRLRGDKLSGRAGRCFVRSVHRFRGGMLIFMQHTGVAKRLFMEVRPPAVAAVGDRRQERIASLPRREWGF